MYIQLQKQSLQKAPWTESGKNQTQFSATSLIFYKGIASHTQALTVAPTLHMNYIQEAISLKQTVVQYSRCPLMKAHVHSVLNSFFSGLTLTLNVQKIFCHYCRTFINCLSRSIEYTSYAIILIDRWMWINANWNNIHMLHNFCCKTF